MSEKAKIRSYRDLLVWQKGMELANDLERMLVSLVKKLGKSNAKSDISNNSMR